MHTLKLTDREVAALIDLLVEAAELADDTERDFNRDPLCPILRKARESWAATRLARDASAFAAFLRVLDPTIDAGS